MIEIIYRVRFQGDFGFGCKLSKFHNQETIADIVREMRTLGRLDEKSTDKIPRSLQALGLRTYADRIEAAARREVAELRECLRMAVVNTRIARTCYAFGRECDSCGQSCDARKWNKVNERRNTCENCGRYIGADTFDKFNGFCEKCHRELLLF